MPEKEFGCSSDALGPAIHSIGAVPGHGETIFSGWLAEPESVPIRWNRLPLRRVEPFGAPRGEAVDPKEGAVRSAPEPQRGLGTCFGYEVHSGLPFRSLRPGGGAPLEVTDTAREPRTTDEDPLLHWFDEAGKAVAEVYQRDGAFDVRIDEVGWFQVDPSTPSVAAPKAAHEVRREARLWGIPAILCFLQRGDLPFHAAAVDVDGSALLLAAPGRHGKSTLAGAFLRAGHRVLSEDVACCRGRPNASVLPGPAMLRIRRDMYERLDFPGTDMVAEDPDRVYLTIDESQRGDASPLPIRGVVFLRPSEGQPAMERLARELAVPDLWSLSLNLPTDQSRAHSFQEVTALAAEVPLWNLYRRLKVDQLPETVDRIVSACLP